MIVLHEEEDRFWSLDIESKTWTVIETRIGVDLFGSYIFGASMTKLDESHIFFVANNESSITSCILDLNTSKCDQMSSTPLGFLDPWSSISFGAVAQDAVYWITGSPHEVHHMYKRDLTFV